MYPGYGMGGMGGMGNEAASDAMINRMVPGGINSAAGEMMDNMMGGNPNPTMGQVYGGAPGVGGFGGYGY